MNQIKKTIIILIIFSLIFGLFGCEPPEKEVVYISDHAFLLDTIVNIKIYSFEDEEADKSIIDGAFELIEKYENILSIHVEGSDLDRLAKNAGKAAIDVDPETLKILRTSLAYSKRSNGKFDVTSGPLIQLWAIDPPYGHLPTAEELARVLPLIGYNRLLIQDNGQVMLKDPGMIADLGAIAKGAITDLVKAYLIENGVTSAIINTGGNVQVIGSKPDGSDFKIGIQVPGDDRGLYLMSLIANDKTIVSSGDYERFFEVDGKTYHHILDPFTGYPADTNISQVSIITDKGIHADALSTTVLLLGIKDGLALINSLDDVDAIFITKDNKIYLTEALRPISTENEELIGDYTIVDDPTLLY